jgi:hypothetical protein
MRSTKSRRCNYRPGTASYARSREVTLKRRAAFATSVEPNHPRMVHMT